MTDTQWRELRDDESPQKGDQARFENGDRVTVGSIRYGRAWWQDTFLEGPGVRFFREVPERTLPTEPGSVVRWFDGLDFWAALRAAAERPWTVDGETIGRTDSELIEYVGKSSWEVLVPEPDLAAVQRAARAEVIAAALAFNCLTSGGYERLTAEFGIEENR